RLAGGYVELIRNVPLLLQILFWYNAVLKSLPDLRSSISISGGAFLNNRGLFLPRLEFADKFVYVAVALVFGTVATGAVRICARRHPCRIARPDRSGAGDRIALGKHTSAYRGAAGDAGDRAAPDQPISQSDQEFVARGRDRLSRSRASLRRKRAQHHRPSRRS